MLIDNTIDFGSFIQYNLLCLRSSIDTEITPRRNNFKESKKECKKEYDFLQILSFWEDLAKEMKVSNGIESRARTCHPLCKYCKHCRLCWNCSFPRKECKYCPGCIPGLCEKECKGCY